MEQSNIPINPQEHILNIFKEYTTPSRVLRSFTNLSNTVIQTALSGQSKFVFEILQNADDAFEQSTKNISVQFILHDNYLIVHHNGKGFDYNDVERICDYASQIEEVKATDLSKTGYKGLGFKSLFNLSDCIYIYSNGYSFRFDKSYWTDPQSKPWQVIPIWCNYDELPLYNELAYDQPVNFILKVNDLKQIENQLREIVIHPELLLYLYRINKLNVILNGEKYFLERKIESFKQFNKIDFFKNQQLESTWLLKTYERTVPNHVKEIITEASRFIYPDKIKKAKKIPFTFALRSKETLTEISNIKGFCYSTLPTQLHLELPYHINSIFILNLDRTQLHENEWNEFLMYEVGQLQLILLKDLAVIPHLKNYVIQLYVREITHPYAIFSKAFTKGFTEAKSEIGWLPAHQGTRLLKLGEAWSDEIEFFKQNFQNIRDHKIYPYLIDYDVLYQRKLLSTEGEAKHFTFFQLLRDLPGKYYSQLTKNSYVNFISYLYEKLKNFPPNYSVMSQLKHVTFLITKNGTLLCPKEALLEEIENPIPDFSMLNPVDNKYLPSSNINLIKDWLVLLGARRLLTPIEILRESVLKWIDSGSLELLITEKNHIVLINYLSNNVELLTRKELEKLKEKLLILTESNQFKLAKFCYLPEAIPIRELTGIFSKNEIISCTYDMDTLKGFFIHVGVHDKLNPVDVFRKSILAWIKKGEVHSKLNKVNYYPLIDYFALHYPVVEHCLTENERAELRKGYVLTWAETFQRAEDCFFDTAIPDIKGLEYVVARNKLVPTCNISNNVCKFLSKIGVSKKISPVDVIRRSVVKWIQEGQVERRITIHNHFSILEYIAENWPNLNSHSGLKPKEIKALKDIPVLTKSGTLRAACNCYWPASSSVGSHYEEIPGLDKIISQNEFVSSDYQSVSIKILLNYLGVRNLVFTVIYDRYCNHLTCLENVKWFFSRLLTYWKKNNKACNTDNLLNELHQKFKYSCHLLAKNGREYKAKDIYSSRFYTMHEVNPNAVPVLDFEKLPEDLEEWLSFKMNLDLKSITQLFNALKANPEFGKKDFFLTVLEELKQIDRNEIKKCKFSLLSKENKLRPAKDLYYFQEEDVTCYLESCYLKRVHGMSHYETLELAEMCGVNILPFKQEIKRDGEICVEALKEFYLERLPFIVIQESKELNENPCNTLKNLYSEIRCIKLYQCRHIYVQYPFGNSKEIRNHFDNLTFYVEGKWTRLKTKIHKHIAKELKFKTDITEIIDMEPITNEDKQEWLRYQNEENNRNFYLVESELRKLRHNQGKIDALISSHQTYSDLLDTKEFATVECSSDDSSVCSTEYELVPKTKHLIDHELCSDESSHESSIEFVENEPDTNSKYLSIHNDSVAETLSAIKSIFDFLGEIPSLQTQNAEIKSESNETSFVLKDEPVTCNTTSFLEDFPKLPTRALVSVESETDIKKETQQPAPHNDNFSPECHNTDSIELLQNNCDKNSRIKWLSEKYVFTFLQEHYKSKYPNSQFNLLNEKFILKWQLHKIEIIWLNRSEDKEYPYDLLLKKDDVIKRLIEVKSTNRESSDSFHMSHSKFVEKINQLAAEFPEHKEKYCIYNVFNADCSLTSLAEWSKPTALYKIVSLKNPQIRSIKM